MDNKVVICLCIITMLSNASFSLIAPFYPLEVQEKEINQIYIGFLMGIQAVTFIISSFVTGIYLDKIGRSRGMILGCLLVIVSIVGLGLLDFVDSKLWFVLLSFVWKFLCGVGAGINSTSSFAIISTHFKAERERYIGYMENASGLGLLLGPTAGSVLYKFGGYMAPFFTMASVYFLLYPLIVFSLKKIRELETKILNNKLKETDDHKDSPHINHSPEFEVKYSLLFKIPRFALGCISQMLVYMTVTFLQPTLAIHLTSFGYQELFVGLSFALPTVVYAITCTFIYKLTKIYKKSGVIFIGYGVTSIGMLLVGPSQMLGLIDSEKITMAGLCIMGFGAAMIIIPVMPDMIEVAEKKYPHMEKEVLQNKISGLFISSQGIGEALGPILGSVFEELVGFRLSQDIVALVLLVFMIIYYIFCGRKSLLEKIPELKDNLSPLLDKQNLSETKVDQEQNYLPPVANSSIQ